VAVPTPLRGGGTVGRMATLEDDLRAATAARRELGDEYEQGVIASFADRLGREVDRRVDERLAAHGPARGGLDWTALLLALGSIAMTLGVPSATHDQFGTAASFVLTLIAWAVIAAINVTYFRRRR
jgi:hypothetical protein